MQVDVAGWEVESEALAATIVVEAEALRLAAAAVEVQALRLAGAAVEAEAVHLVATITVLGQCSLALRFPTETFSQSLVIQFSTGMCS